jgi:hypothetical protein
MENLQSLKHTPGPWLLENNIAYGWKTNPYSISTRKPGVHSVAIANIPAKQTISRDEALANARLISAAPDLLDALMTFPQSLAWTDDELWAWAQRARAAIAKATGEGK